MESGKERDGQNEVISGCASCSGVQWKGERWESLDAFLRDRYGLVVRRCLCPECRDRFYPELANCSGGAD